MRVYMRKTCCLEAKWLFFNLLWGLIIDNFYFNKKNSHYIKDWHELELRTQAGTKFKITKIK